MKLKVELTIDEIREFLNPPFFVESWEIKFRSKRFKTKFIASFTKYQWERLRKFHALFYDWTMNHGIPNTSQHFSLYDMEIVRKANNIFYTGEKYDISASIQHSPSNSNHLFNLLEGH